MTKQEVIDVIKAFVAYGEHVQAFAYKGNTSIPIEALNMAIDVLEQEPKWIPCSERLPKYRQIVIVSSYWGVNTAYRDSVSEDGTDDYWELIERDSTVGSVYIYAWMPLPEPYKEVEI